MRLLHKLRHLVGRGARVRRLEEEMRTHIELMIDEGVRQGLPRTEASRRAHLAFGNVLSAREEAEDSLGWPALESLVHDARIAFRTLTRRPAFSMSLIAILALGIGVTTAIFTVVRGMLWQALPVPNPTELNLAVDNRDQPFLFSAAAIQRLGSDSAFAGQVAGYTDNCGLTFQREHSAAESAQVRFVTGEFFHALQIGPRAGRLLTAGDDLPGQPRAVMVISSRWWKQKFGSDPAIVGRTLRFNNEPVTIVGIAPADFAGVALGEGPDAWLPLGLHAALRARPSAWTVSRNGSPSLRDWVRDEHVSWVRALVRVKPGTIGAQGILESAWRPQLATVLDVIDEPNARSEISRNVPRLRPSPAGYSTGRNRFRTVGLTLSLLVGAVILVTAANTSTLLLLRMMSRRRELGVRLALGAGRWRLARSALMEGLLLSLGGAVLGVLVGLWLTPLLARWLVPGAADELTGVNGELLAGLAALAIALGLVLGAAPAWLSAHLSPQSVLQQRGNMDGSLRLGRLLIVLQLALSVVLISVATSLGLDLRRVLRTDLGYGRESVVTTYFNLDAAGFPPEQFQAIAARLRNEASSIPGAKAAGLAANGALSGSRSQSGIYFRGDGVHQPKDSVQTESVDEGYFGAMGLTLLRGRGISRGDVDGHPRVAVISRQLAREVFGDADPIGRRFGFDQTSSADDWEIVGVASDARLNDVRDDPTALVYLPLAQWGGNPHYLAVRIEGNAVSAPEAMQKQIALAEPAILFSRWTTIEQRVQSRMNKDMAAVGLTAGFGILATLLAVVGVFGALGYLVASRSREIAVRLAIGAEPGRIRRSIVRDALVLGLAGGGLGIALALALPHWLSSWMMTGLRAEPVAIAFATICALLAAVLGGFWPARRAARVDPLTLLRAE